ncbi:MAG: cell division protein FtsZ [Candidatus Aenigmatarchaeota archaeon]
MGVKQYIKLKEVKTSKIDEELKKIVEEGKAKIKVVGAGGAGCNTITRLMSYENYGIKTIAINTDALDLLNTIAHQKILIGKNITKGAGAGANPKIGEDAAIESKEEIKKALENTDIVFLTCGLGGGTGSGSLPVIAEIAKRLGCLTIAIVTLPFSMEGKQRQKNAIEALTKLEKNVDTLIVIPNDKLKEIVPHLPLLEAFEFCDEILIRALKGISDLINKPGLINRDFADVKTIMSNSGLAMIGIGESQSENRAKESIEKALKHPLITVDITNATGALVYITAGPDLTLKEAEEIISYLNSKMSDDAKIIWGASIDRTISKIVRTTVIVTGVSSPNIFSVEKPFSKVVKDVEKTFKIDYAKKIS